MKHLCAAWSFFIFSLLVSTYKWGIFKFDHVHAWMIRAWIWSSNVLVESVVCIRRRPSPVSNVVLRHIPCTSLKAPWTSILSSCTQTSWMVHIRTTNRAEKKIAPVCGFLRPVCGFFALGLRVGFLQSSPMHASMMWNSFTAMHAAIFYISNLCVTDLKMAVHAWCHPIHAANNPQTERKKSANRAQKIRKRSAKNPQTERKKSANRAQKIR